jgi:hypothetical protein
MLSIVNSTLTPHHATTTLCTFALDFQHDCDMSHFRYIMLKSIIANSPGPEMPCSIYVSSSNSYRDFPTLP